MHEIASYEVDDNLRRNYSSYTFLKGFCCGEALLDDYFKTKLKRALKSENVTGIGAINDKGELFAFCTLTFLMLDKARVQAHLEHANQPQQVPAVKLSMLAVDLNYQGQGIGAELLMIAFDQAIVVHNTIPVKGMYLDAAPKAIRFYQSLGFEMLDEAGVDGTTPMFLPIRTMVAAAAAASVASG
ncbi:GNAT family N-acetyltransferase [Pseudomonas farsensis]|uniref:GNAT family N-acetyltransferase n=1 Tax=Pseudomonas farsensis TaxID=2745492 RepID=A0ABU8QTQ6_9PSED